MVDQVVAAAKEAYLEAPNTDPKVAEVLIGTLVDEIENDDYEPAFKLGKMLMDNSLPRWNCGGFGRHRRLLRERV